MASPVSPGPVPVTNAYDSGTLEQIEAGKRELTFDDKSIRRSFIRKVFGIVSIQLLLVTALIALFIFCQPVKDYVQRTEWPLWVSLGLFIVTYLAIACIKQLRRTFPANIIFLAVLTFAIGYIAAAFSSFFDTQIVFLAMGTCAVCCIGIIVFAAQTRFDFTMIMGGVYVFGLVVVMFGFISTVSIPIKGAPSTLNILYSSLMSLVFMLYLAIDVQLIMGGKRHEISPEDYVFAAAQIFLDIINLFLLILRLFGGSGGSS